MYSYATLLFMYNLNHNHCRSAAGILSTDAPLFTKTDTRYTTEWISKELLGKNHNNHSNFNVQLVKKQANISQIEDRSGSGGEGGEHGGGARKEKLMTSENTNDILKTILTQRVSIEKANNSTYRVENLGCEIICSN